MTPIRLRGITWDHPRGYAPLEATARSYGQSHPEVHIEWERRSLQAFADFPLDVLAAGYDLLVVDHPHVGSIAAAPSLMPLEEVAPAEILALLARDSIGRSHASYEYDGHQWALAIDATAQVAAYRPDLLPDPPQTWEQVVDLARKGRVLWPLKPVDAICSFFTLAANRGTPCAAGPERLIDPGAGQQVLADMRAVADAVRPECLGMNPPEALDRLSGSDDFWYCPLLFGYSNYARDGFRDHLIAFADIPAAGSNGPEGAILGGAGLAVSTQSGAIEAAVAYGLWIAGAECQRGLYFEAEGQPAHTAAWDDDADNAVCHNFFRNVRKTMDRSWLRPRYDGFIDFQDAAGHLINAFLGNEITAEDTLRQLERAYAETQ